MYKFFLISVIIFLSHTLCFGMKNNDHSLETKKLLIYVRSGHEQLVKRFLEQKADPNAISEWGLSTLTLSQQFECSSDIYRNVTRLLKEYGACKYPTIFIAIEEGNSDDILQHLKNGANINDRNEKQKSPLDLAITLRNIDIVKLLLKWGADPGLGPEIPNSSALKIATQAYIKLKSQAENEKLIKIILGYILSFKSKPEKQLKILCQSNDIFNKWVVYFLIALKTATTVKIKVPKPLVYIFLLKAWSYEHPDDYRCKIWFGDTQRFIAELINNSDILTNIDLQLKLNDTFRRNFKLQDQHTWAEEEACLIIKKLLESYF